MLLVEIKIHDINKVINKNITSFESNERGFLSQNILSQLRNLIEHLSVRAMSNELDIPVTYEKISEANNYVKGIGKFKILAKFHKLIQIIASHYTLDENNSERLMLKYYEYLIQVKKLARTEFNIEILEKIYNFPVNQDTQLLQYYEKIVAKIIQPPASIIKNDKYKDRFYIQKIKPFFVRHEVFYEVTFTRANDFVSKFDRIIAFTNLEIPSNYAVKLDISSTEIEILENQMPIKIIDTFEVSIRPCELNNFADIFGYHHQIGTNMEYKNLMSFLTSYKVSLLEVVDLKDSDFNYFENQISQNAKSLEILSLLKKCRAIIINNKDGSNVLRYLLLKMNNKIIKKQIGSSSCRLLSNLYLDWGCIPFDQMPLNTSLKGHNPRIGDLLESMNINDRQHEIFARFIKNETEQKGNLFTQTSQISGFEEIETLTETYNSKLYKKHTNRKLLHYKNHIYISDYVENTHEILKIIKEYSLKGISGYAESVDNWLSNGSYQIDCAEKSSFLRVLFEKSKVAMIYGSAGTGKTTMINHISNFFSDSDKLYLANTNPAIDNLKRKVTASNCEFLTISKFVNNPQTETEYDLLIVDESSTVSNADMLKILHKGKFELLIFVGDTYQIQSILFGNWFNTTKQIIPNTSIFELKTPYRSSDNGLLSLWNKVRNIEDDLLEHITRNDYSHRLDSSIFSSNKSDEIILCLNYDGLYGINNINNFLQSNNHNQEFIWGTDSFKVGDPVLFNEKNRFSPLIYNNLKGKISKILPSDKSIQFFIEIDKVINEFDARFYDFELVEISSGKSIISFFVNQYPSTDEDDELSDTLVPFQVAYAVSIHKAQGLEYDSVKIIITSECDEKVNHSIFYTAITRAKSHLKIYWTPETEKKILSSFKIQKNKKDIALLKAKYPEL